MKNINIQNDINKLIIWASKKEFFIEFKSNAKDVTHFDEKIIYINSNNSLEIQLYTILHECGHILIYNNKNYSIEFPLASKNEWPPTNKKLFKNNQFRYEIINEEMEAWKKGKKLAKKLNIEINNKIYTKETVKSVLSYIKYLMEEYE